MRVLRNRLHEQFTQEWHSLIQNSPKDINYRLFKDNFEFENYFNILEDKDIYTLRLSIRPLIGVNNVKPMSGGRL
jgi:hypothetical protein